MNTFTTGTQFRPAIAMDADGNFVVVWESEGQDGDGWGIFAQRYDSTCRPVGPEFRVNTVTAGDQFDRAVAMDAGGNFIVVWQSRNPDGTFRGVFAQRYGADGTPQGGEFQVASGSPVAMDADGDFVVAAGRLVEGSSESATFAQRFNASGIAQGAEFQVSVATAGFQFETAVAMDADGNFIIVWCVENQDGSGFGIFGRRYDANGVAQGSEFRVNTFTGGDQRQPAVAMDAGGDFVVAWDSGMWTDGGQKGVFGQRYNAAGVAQGGEFQVNTSAVGKQVSPAVAIDADGDFVVVWEDTSQARILAQAYDASGTRHGPEFQLHADPGALEYRFLPAVAMDAVGNFVAAWTILFNDPVRVGVFARGFPTSFLDTGFRGRVWDASKNPVAGAMVTAFEAGISKAAAITGPLGRYSLPLLAGTYDLVASQTGYLDATRTLTISEGQTLTGVSFRLFHPSLFQGTVTDRSNGAPLEGALVEAVKDGVVKFSTTTAADGTYSLQVRKGIYTLRVSQAGYGTRRKRDQRIGDGVTKTGVNFALAPLP